MCHQAHLSDTNPLASPGEKGITAHINFTGIAPTAQDAGLDVPGYSRQARFLINCSLPGLMQGAALSTLSAARKPTTEHEMGKLFKFIALARGVAFEPIGFAAGGHGRAWQDATPAMPGSTEPLSALSSPSGLASARRHCRTSH